jgi:O-antigen/teichoic acid export membrane protein
MLQDTAVAEHSKSRMPPHGRLHRLTSGTTANLLRQATSIFGQLAIVPILLTHWGNQLYGEWQILAAAVTYIALLDFGMQTYVVNRMNQAYSLERMREFTRILHSALWFTLSVSFAAILIILPVMIFAPLGTWFHLQVTSRGAASLIAAFLAFQSCCSLPAGVMAGIYRAVGEYAREVSIANGYRVSVLVLTAAIALSGGGLVLVAVMQAVALVAVTLFQYQDLRRRHPDIYIGISERDLKLAWSFVGPSSLFLLMQVSLALAFQGGTLLTGAIMGAASVAIFVTLRTLVNAISQATGAFSGTLWPEFTSLEARGDYETLRAAHRLASKFLLAFTCSAAVFLHFTARDVVAWWTNSRIVYDPRLMDAFLLLQITEGWYIISQMLLVSSNRHQTIAFCRVLSGALGFALGYFLGRRMGAAGVVLGFLLADLMTCGWFIPWSACRMLGQGFSRFANEVLLRGLLLLAALYGLTYFLSTTFSVRPGPDRLLLFGPALGVSTLALAYTLYFNARERSRLRLFVSMWLTPREA